MFEGDVRRKVLTLLSMCFALFTAMLDNTVVNVALPTLSRELGTGVSGRQWIVDGYVLAFASLLLTGGILGDRYGRSGRSWPAWPGSRWRRCSAGCPRTAGS